MSAYENLCARLAEVTGVKSRNGSWPCPAHDDNDPSLSVSQGDKGALAHCHAGCATKDVMSALGLPMSALFDSYWIKGNTLGGMESLGKVIATYDYVDETGALLYQVVRHDPKNFRQRQPDGNGGWISNIDGCRRVLYRLPEVLAAKAEGKAIWLPEGEKDADAIVAAGGVATTNARGAKEWKPEYAESLAGATVRLVANDDEPGRKRARTVAAELRAAGCTVTVLKARQGKDAADHLAAGFGLEDFEQLELSDHDEDDPSLDLAALLAEDAPDDQWLLDEVFALRRGHVIYARREQQKSLFTFWACIELVTKRDDVDVVYLDYEMPRDEVRDRLLDLGFGSDNSLSQRLHYWLFPNLPPLDTEAGAEALERHIKRYLRPDRHVLVVIDTMSRAVEGEENNNDTVRNFYRLTGLMLRRLEVTWVRLDHAGKDATKEPSG